MQIDGSPNCIKIVHNLFVAKTHFFDIVQCLSHLSSDTVEKAMPKITLLNSSWGPPLDEESKAFTTRIMGPFHAH